MGDGMNGPGRLGCMVLAALSGCSLLIEDKEEDPLRVIEIECLPEFAHLFSMRPIPEVGAPQVGIFRTLGQRRFDVLDGVGGLVTADGGLARFDLSQPLLPTVAEVGTIAGFEIFFIGLEGGRIQAIGSDGNDLVVADLANLQDAPPLYEVGNFDVPAQAYLSVAQGCGFAGESGDPLYAWPVGSNAPPVENNLVQDAEMGIGRNGLGYGEDGVVQALPAVECGIVQTPVLQNIQGDLLTVDGNLGYFAQGRNVVVRDLLAFGEVQATLNVGQPVVDVWPMQEDLIVAVARDILVYASVQSETPQQVLPLLGTVVAVWPIFDGDKRYIHALTVRQPPNENPRYELVVVDPERECDS